MSEMRKLFEIPIWKVKDLFFFG